MLRYFITFPAGIFFNRSDLEVIREQLKDAANDREWRDIVATMGGTLHDVRHPRVKPKFNQMPVR